MTTQFGLVFSILLSQSRSSLMIGTCPSPRATRSKVHPSESTGGTDTEEVEDAKLERTLRQESTTEDEEEEKRDGCS